MGNTHARSFAIAVAVIVVAVLVALAMIEALGGADFAYGLIDPRAGADPSQMLSLDAIEALKQASLNKLHIMIIGGGAVVAVFTAIWLWSSHRIEIDRPGVAGRSLLLWLLLGVGGMACCAALILVQTFDSSARGVTFLPGMWVRILLCGLAGAALVYWLASVLATPRWMRPAVPLASALP